MKLQTASRRVVSGAIAFRPFSPQTHCTCLLPVLSISIQRRRTLLERFFGRKKKKEPSILNPLDPGFLKRSKPEAPPEQPPKQGDLAPGSIIDDVSPLSTDPTKTPTETADVAHRDPRLMAPALDPVPRNRRRWQRKMLIRDIRRRGHLSKTEIIKRTERESLSRSPFFKTSIKKLYPLARQIAGKPIEEAIVQMRFSKKKAAREVKKHLEYARDEAIVRRGMGLGEVKAPAEEGTTSETANGANVLPKGIVVIDKKGTRRWVTDKTNIYVDQAWVGRGTYTLSGSPRARGRTDKICHPKTSISVLLKEEATRIRLAEEREEKRQNRKVWVPLPDRPVTAQRQYPLW